MEEQVVEFWHGVINEAEDFLEDLEGKFFGHTLNCLADKDVAQPEGVKRGDVLVNLKAGVEPVLPEILVLEVVEAGDHVWEALEDQAADDLLIGVQDCH